jgi:hypothetical protein
LFFLGFPPSPCGDVGEALRSRRIPTNQLNDVSWHPAFCGSMLSLLTNEANRRPQYGTSLRELVKIVKILVKLDKKVHFYPIQCIY